MNRIEWNPKVCNGKPVIKGTRIPVSVILDQVAERVSWEDILENYPGLTLKDIQAAIHFAGESLEHSHLEVIGA